MQVKFVTFNSINVLTSAIFFIARQYTLQRYIDTEVSSAVIQCWYIVKNGYIDRQTFSPSARALILFFEPKRRYKICPSTGELNKE